MSLVKNEDYVELARRGNQICIKCRAEDCEGGNITVENGRAYQDMTCAHCGHEWTDIYQLIRYKK